MEKIVERHCMDNYCMGDDGDERDPFVQLTEFLSEYVTKWADGARPQPAEISRGHGLVYTAANKQAQALQLYDLFVDTIKDICGTERGPAVKGEPLYDRYKRVITPLKGILKYVDQFPPNKGRYGPCLKEAAQLIWTDPEWTISKWTPPPLPKPVEVKLGDGAVRVDSDGRRRKDRNRDASPRKGCKEDSCLHAACTGGSVETVLTLLTLTEGPSIDYQSPSDGATPIMRACEFGHLPACKVMLEQKCDLHIKTHRGETALHIALAHNQNEIAEWLLSVGAQKCGPRCMKCKLGLKSLNKALEASKQPKTAVGCPAVMSEAEKLAEFDRVMEEEFGSMTLEEEMEKMRAEMAGSSMFSNSGATSTMAALGSLGHGVDLDVDRPVLDELPEWLQRGESAAGEGETETEGTPNGSPNKDQKKKRSRGGAKKKKKR